MTTGTIAKTASPRLAVFDLDGTLIHTGERIADRAAAQVAALVADGLPCALASARLDESMAVVNRAIGDPLIRISYNGALTTMPDGRVAHEVHFTVTEQLAEALAAFTQVGTIDVYATGGRWLAYGQDEAIDREEHDTWCTATLRAPRATAADLTGLEVLKILVEGPDEPLEKVYAAVDAMPGLNVTHSGNALHDIWPATSGKGNALADLCEQLGISPDEVIAVGDSQTDLPMLQLAGTSIGVAPCSDAVREAATIIVDGAGSDELFAAVRRAAGLPPRTL